MTENEVKQTRIMTEIIYDVCIYMTTKIPAKNFL